MLVAGPAGSGKSALATQFVAAGLQMGEPAVIAVKADAPYKTLGDFVNAAKQKPGELKQSGGSITSRDNVVRQQLQKATAVNFDEWQQELESSFPYEETPDQLAALDDAGWTRKGQFFAGGKMMLEQPIGEFLWFILFDAIHHRGQLSTYIRPMGGQVPAIYGPSGDSRR